MSKCSTLLAAAKLRMQSDRRVVAMIGLHEADIHARSTASARRAFDPRRRDASLRVRFADREAVDVDLRSRLLELGEHTGGKAPTDRCSCVATMATNVS